MPSSGIHMDISEALLTKIHVYEDLLHANEAHPYFQYDSADAWQSADYVKEFRRLKENHTDPTEEELRAHPAKVREYFNILEMALHKHSLHPDFEYKKLVYEGTTWPSDSVRDVVENAIRYCFRNEEHTDWIFNRHANGTGSYSIHDSRIELFVRRVKT